MKGVPYAKEKIEGYFHGCLVTWCQQPLINQCSHGVGLIKRRADPESCMVIPQAPWAFFDVRLHEVHGVGEDGVTLPAFSNFLSDKRVAPPRREAVMSHLLLKPCKQRLISINKADFQHGSLGGDVGVRHFHYITSGSHTVSESVADIPKEVEGIPYDLVWRGLLAEKHKVNIRKGV